MSGADVFQRCPYKRRQHEKIAWVVSAPAIAQIAEKRNISAQVKYQKTQAYPAQSWRLAAIVDQRDGDPTQPAKIKYDPGGKTVKRGAMQGLVFYCKKQGHKSHPGKKIHVPAGENQGQQKPAENGKKEWPTVFKIRQLARSLI
jgi:hypothetical protein